jgi:hypothetical protein
MSKEYEDYLHERRYKIKERALMNRMYYQERQRIFEGREGLVKAASIIAGSIAFSKVADPDVIKWCAVVITGGSTASLVFGFGNKARDSAKRSAEWTQLERDIEQVGEHSYTEEQLNQWYARANEIESGEPAAHKILLERCYERAAKALGGKPEEIKLGFCERFFRILPPIMIP